MFKVRVILVLLLTMGIKTHAQKYSNEFLNIGVGGRALAMANANVATAEGAYAGYWNPSGLLGQKSNLDIGLQHAEYFAGIAKYDFVGLSKRIDSNSVAGISLLRFGVDNIANTLDLVDANGNIDYNRILPFGVVDFAALLSYSRRIPKLKGLDIGGNVKIIRRKIGSFGGAWGFGLDASVKYQHKNWILAAMARDVTGTFNAWSYTLDQKTISTFLQTNNKIPSNGLEITSPKLILGVARKFNFWKDRISVLGELDMINTFDGQRNTVISSKLWNLEPAFGLEVGYKGFVFLRGGLGNIQKQLNDRATLYITTVQPNIGVGVKYEIFTLDYALTDIGDRSAALYSNIFSLKIALNSKMNK
ncbi:MAG: PorV/PorQ family protein [Bacteroidia bacterium]|nr:PorV/PorQ family protein [Bacteroidia bacterium]